MINDNVLLTIIVCVISVCLTICYIVKYWIDSHTTTSSKTSKKKAIAESPARGIEIPKWINRTTTTKIIPISKEKE